MHNNNNNNNNNNMYMYVHVHVHVHSRRGRAQLARRSRAAAVVALSDACGGVPHVMGESIFATSPLPIARRGKGGVVDGTRAVELGVAALQRSLRTSKDMKMAPLQTHPQKLAHPPSGTALDAKGAVVAALRRS